MDGDSEYLGDIVIQSELAIIVVLFLLLIKDYHKMNHANNNSDNTNSNKNINSNTNTNINNITIFRNKERLW